MSGPSSSYYFFLVLLLGTCWSANSAFPSPGDAPQTAQKKCATEAFSTYNEALVDLLQQGAGVPTIEAIIARRRLEERYCTQFARCDFPDTSAESSAVQYSLAFSSCLREEALEHYKE